MDNKVYKYLSSNVFKIASEKEGVFGVKFSYPHDYNDPYELFLSIDPSLDTHLLAFYKELIDEIPQLPTSCFSTSPVVPPMWAHYAQNSTGVVVEVNERKLKDYFEDIFIADVQYMDSAHEDIKGELQRALVTLKPRHLRFLQWSVIHHAYCSKQTCWSYEKERRIVINIKEQISVKNGHMILEMPVDCITAVICGIKASSVEKSYAKAFSDRYNIDYYEASIGKSMPEQYLKNRRGVGYIFKDGAMRQSKLCESCAEPLVDKAANGKRCSWCKITDSDRVEAARHNIFRYYHQAGILENYLKKMDEIRRRS